jgi:alkylation response protein AidB-like acyl-CoA dehydrogenase
MTAGAVDRRPSVVPSAIVKYHLTELGRQVANDAMDIHGGKGRSVRELSRPRLTGRADHDQSKAPTSSREG